MPPKIVSICGNIGCGKTTLLKMLESQNSYKCMLEGIKDWGDILELSYSNPDKYSLAFQLRIVSEQTLQKEQISKMNDEFVFIERSSDDGRYIFVNAKKKFNHLDDIMIAEFDRWIQIHKMGIQPDLTVYLKTTPEVAEQRLRSRHQAGDKFVDITYLEMLHDFYEKRYNNQLRDKNKEYLDFEIPPYPHQDKVLILENLSPEESCKEIIKWLQ